jgi:hypothetical protein
MQVKESKTNWHFRISLIKSAIRIVAGAALTMGNLYVAGLSLVVAELLGIVEEL